MLTDFYDISSLLNDEQRMIRDTVRDFVVSEVLPIIEEHNQAMTFPMELIPKIAALGLLGPTLPKNMAAPDSIALPTDLSIRSLSAAILRSDLFPACKVHW